MPRMSSKEEAKSSSGTLHSSVEERRRSPLDHLPPPANSNKPLTPFSIEDILNKPSVRRGYTLCGSNHLLSAADKHTASAIPLNNRAGVLTQTSPLCALEELASKTFKGLEVSVLQAAEGRDGLSIFGQRSTPKKRRKSRTAFTNHQIYELEKRFLYQKYLSPADRDQIAQQLGLTNAQVITWFQNRRAKLKRDLEEMKADVESAKNLGPSELDKITKMGEIEQTAAEIGSQSRSQSPIPLKSAHAKTPDAHISPSSLAVGHPPRKDYSEEDEEEEEIDVDD
ncbi:transcription factor LBX1-like isoform X2 [Stegostoma tigrinum]|uniref:transcription factor LBX1-like isoform X2 n=1 Tax=Stegostoma tigrinum TaxID=3053191 RepID=UPI00202B07C4|nr:transcription factor LBX1-like isoform X2 [Stegostoma tigrinum]